MKSSVPPWVSACAFAISTTSTACGSGSPPISLTVRSMTRVSSSLMCMSACAAREST
jgi:hypothetical protein